MFRNLLAIVLLFTATHTSAFGGNTYRTYGSDEGGYYYCGLGGLAAGKAILGGGEFLISGNVYRGRLLAGVNANVFNGTSPDDYGFTLSGVKYNYRQYALGLNVGIRLFSGDHIDFTAHVLFGKELLEFGSKDTTENCHCGKYHRLLSNDMWFIRPAISFNNKKNFALTASYNFLFNDALFNGEENSFASTASDFNGPVMSLIWITNRHNRPYHWHRHC